MSCTHVGTGPQSPTDLYVIETRIKSNETVVRFQCVIIRLPVSCEIYICLSCVLTSIFRRYSFVHTSYVISLLSVSFVLFPQFFGNTGSFSTCWVMSLLRIGHAKLTRKITTLLNIFILCKRIDRVTH